MPVVLSLGFTKIRCAHCRSTERIAGFPCPDCGREGRKGEVNSNVVRRRQGVRRVRQLLEASVNGERTPLPYYLVHDVWRTTTASLLRRTLDGFAEFSKDPLNEQVQLEIAGAILELRGASADLQSLPLRRPHIQDLKSRRVAAAYLVEMASAYLLALEASVPLEAQSHAIIGQRAIDQAVGALDEADRDKELIEESGNTMRGDYFGSVLGLFAKLKPGQTIVEVDAEATQRLTREFGHPIAATLGAEYILREFLARAWLDPDCYVRATKGALSVLGDEQALRSVAAEPKALTTVARARDAVVESLNAFDSALSASSSDHDRLRRMVALYRELFEDGAMPLFAWYLRATGARSSPIEQLMKKDATDLLRSIEGHSELSDVFLGADGNIRNAASHGLAYELDGSDVIITLRSRETVISVDVLVDLLLALIESLLAAFWALDNELGRLGIVGHNSERMLEGSSRLPLAVAALEALGIGVSAADENDAQWSFDLTGPRGVKPWMHAYAVAAVFPGNVRRALLSFAQLPQGTLHLGVESLRAFIQQDKKSGMKLVVSMLTLLDSSAVDGVSALTAEHLQRCAQLGVTGLVEEGDLDAVGLLRLCRQIAKGRAMTEVVSVCDLALLQWRAPDPVRLLRVRQKVAPWISLPNPELPVVRQTFITR